VRQEVLNQHSKSVDGNWDRVVDAFWFICLNRVEKLTPGVFADWMLILDRTPGSVLLLFSQSSEIDAQLQRNADALGGYGRRLIFLNRMPKSNYLRALAVADLFLDTPHYGAHTTASDAMFGTLPVLTLPRETVASRVAASLNTAVSLSLLNTYSAKEYVDVAVRLFHSPSALAYVRRRILGSLGNEIFNSERFAGHLEHAYEAVYDLYPSFKHVYLVA